MPSCMFKEESNREETKNRDSKRQPAQLKKNDNYASQDVKVQEGISERNCVAGPVLTRAQVKKSDKINSLKGYVKCRQELQKKDSTLRNALIE